MGESVVESSPSSELEPKRRRTTRIVQAVPVTVIGVDALGRPFQERTSTLIINCQGCRYQSKHYVLKNMWVTLEIPHPESGREPRGVRARVTWIQRPRTVRELFQIGVELEVPGNVWGIAFPPEDWFPFAEAPVPEIPVPRAEAESGVPAPAEEWVLPPSVPQQDNVHVLPGPGPADASLTLARQVARLVVEAKQQLQNAAREATAQAVAAETRPLLAALHNQMNEAAEKAVQAAGAAYADEAIRQTNARIEEARHAGLESLRDKLMGELQRHLEDAGPQLAEHLAKIGSAHQAAFEQKLANQFQQALENLSGLGSEISGSATNTAADLARFRQQVEETTETASRRWQESFDGRLKEAAARLEGLEKIVRELNNEIAAAAASAQAGWRARLDADLAAASARWNEKAEASLEGAARQAAERLARHSQTATAKLEQELTLRVAALRQSFEQATAEAESTLGTLRAALSKETARAKTSLGEIQQAAGRLSEFSSRLDVMSQAAAQALQQRCEAILAAESEELSRRAESAIAGIVERMHPMLETAGQQSLGRLGAQLEQQMTPHLERAQQLLQKLVASQGENEEALRAQDQRLQRASEDAIQAAMGRLQESVARFEKDFQEAGRTATATWLAELEAKATDVTHTTFEALYRSSEWYEKKVQTHMQATIDKGLEQAANSLREKAGEISGLFASELDHYSRSYVEHTQGQMDETIKEGIGRARGQLTQAAETTAATYGDQMHGMAQREFDQFSASLADALGKTTARLDTHIAQVRAKIEADARQFFVEFNKRMAGQVQQGAAQVRQELEAQLAPVKDAWRTEREAQEQRLQEALANLGNESIDAYKKRLENVSNSWLLATVTKLSQQSQNMIGTLATSAEQQLRETCSQVFASVGEALRQRMLDFSTHLSAGTPPEKK